MNLRLSSAPHLHSRQTTAGIMRDVLIALLPSVAAAVYLFGSRAALILAGVYLANYQPKPSAKKESAPSAM